MTFSAFDQACSLVLFQINQVFLVTVNRRITGRQVDGWTDGQDKVSLDRLPRTRSVRSSSSEVVMLPE